jgi:hypothetical protein
MGNPVDILLYLEELSKLGMIYAVYGLVLKVSDNYNL